MKKTILLQFFLCLLLTGIIFPQQEGPGIVLQGMLRDQTNRQAPDGEYTMTFAIYDRKTGGTALWTSGPQSVKVNNGVFNAQLKNFGANVTFTSQYFVGMTVSGMGNELSPRIELSAAPYTLGINGSENKVGGDGNVGFGTTNPTERLEVNGNVKISGYLETGETIALSSRLRFKQGGGGLYDSFDKPLLQQSSTDLTGASLVFKPGGSTNSPFSFQLNDNNGFESDNNTPFIVNNSEWTGGIKFYSSLNNAISGENYTIRRGGDFSTKNMLALTIEDDMGSGLSVISGENNSLLKFDGNSGSVGLGLTPNPDSKLDVNGSIFVNGAIPFEYKEFQAYGTHVEVNTNYDADKWFAQFAGIHPNGFDVNEYPGSNLSQYCFVKNGKIHIKSILPAHMYNPLQRLYILFIRKELVDGAMPVQ